MPLATPVLQQQLDKAFVDAMKAMIKISKDGGNKISETKVLREGGDVFGQKAAAAIDAWVKTGLVTTVVVTAGSAVAQAGTGSGTIT